MSVQSVDLIREQQDREELTDEQIEKAKRWFKSIQVRAQLKGWGWLKEEERG